MAGRLGSHVRFSCEKQPNKVEFLIKQFAPDRLFTDAAELLSGYGHCAIKEERVQVPWVSMIAAGFPCTSRTSLSSHSGSNKHCVQNEEGATGEGWAIVRDYIFQFKPHVFLLENVPNLAATSDDATCMMAASDADHIVQTFQQRGMWCTYFAMDSREYGSFCERKRLYFLGGSGVSEYSETMSHQIALSCSIGPGNLSDFMWVENTDLKDELAQLGLEEAQEGEAVDCDKNEPLYKDKSKNKKRAPLQG